MRRVVIGAAAVLLALTSPVMAMEDAAAPIGKMNAPVAPGRTVTITVPGASNTAAVKTADGTTWNPQETITVHGLTKTEIAALPKGAIAVPLAGADPALSSGYRAAYTAGCWTATVKDGTSQLWAKMSQTWCGSTDPGVLVYYWPAASCWGYSAWYAPSYKYGGCSTSQVYGLYWNAGNTTWDYQMCPFWNPATSQCYSWSYGHRVYRFQYNGAWGRL